MNGKMKEGKRVNVIERREKESGVVGCYKFIMLYKVHFSPIFFEGWNKKIKFRIELGFIDLVSNRLMSY